MFLRPEYEEKYGHLSEDVLLSTLSNSDYIKSHSNMIKSNIRLKKLSNIHNAIVSFSTLFSLCFLNLFFLFYFFGDLYSELGVLIVFAIFLVSTGYFISKYFTEKDMVYAIYQEKIKAIENQMNN